MRWQARATVAWMVVCLYAAVHPAAAADTEGAAARDYANVIASDQPVAYWSFTEGRLEGGIRDDLPLRAALEGEVALQAKGPRPPIFPLFPPENDGISLGGHGFLRVADPGDASPLDFAQGDALTLEAWVNPSALEEGQQVYLVGKGRTNREGVAKDNQNYALRLRMMSGTARVSFLFRSAGEHSEFQRWNSAAGFVPGSGWHHVAVSYQFGSDEPPKTYVDGVFSEGAWDMGSGRAAAPVVDNDELWIGSSMGGNVGSSFAGSLDEVAIYRVALPAERIAARYEAHRELAEKLDTSRWPDQEVEVEIFDGVPERSWEFALQEPFQRFREPGFALSEMPKRYTHNGVIATTPNPFLVRAQARIALPAGKYRFVLRAKNGARLTIDGRELVKTGWMSRNASGHEHVPDLLPPLVPGMRLCPPSHQEAVVECELDGEPHGFRIEAIVGGKGLRPELGELVVAWQPAAQPQADFIVLAPGTERVAFTEAAWRQWLPASQDRVRKVEQAIRQEATQRDADYWLARRELARRQLAGKQTDNLPLSTSGELPVEQRIDFLIAAQAGLAAPNAVPLVDDDVFLRRLYLDVVGVIPMPEEIARFFADAPEQRRSLAIERVLPSVKIKRTR